MHYRVYGCAGVLRRSMLLRKGSKLVSGAVETAKLSFTKLYNSEGPGTVAFEATASESYQTALD